MHTWYVTTHTGKKIKRFKDNGDYTRLVELIDQKNNLDEFFLITPFETRSFAFPVNSCPDFFNRTRIIQSGKDEARQRWWFYGYTTNDESFYLVYNEDTKKITTLENSTRTPE